jgi:hypothetical protein
MFENGVLRKIFGSRGDEVTGRRRTLHNEELYSFYSLPNVIRVMKSRRVRWARYVARMEGIIYAYKVLVGKPEGKRLLGRPRRRWENNIKIDLK